MKQIKLFAFFTFFFPFVCFAQADDPSMDCSSETVNFMKGEKMVYQLYYNWKFVWIPAGEVAFEVFETDTTYELTVTGITYPSYDSFFKVRDYYKASVDKASMLPNYFRRDILEGNYILYDSIRFDHKKNQLTEYIANNKTEVKSEVFDFENCTLDLVSLVYKLRNLSNEKITNDMSLSLFFDKQHYDLDLKYLGEENKKVKGWGKVKSLKYTPEVIVGDIFTEYNKMNLWITNDDNRIPIMVESPIFLGTVKAVLKYYKNLSHPSVLPNEREQ